MNYVLKTFEENINYVDPTGIKLYLQSNMDIYKETGKLYISVPNDKYIIDNFLILSNKYGWGFLVFLINTGTGAKNIFRVK